jgi:hypothetical protein
MSRKSFLTLVSIVAMCVGAVALWLPAALLESKGVGPNPAANVWVREVGVALTAIAVVAFLVRGHADSCTMKAFLLGNAVLQFGLLPIEIMAFANGTLTRLSGIIPNSVLHAVLGAAFVYYAMTVRPATARGSRTGEC